MIELLLRKFRSGKKSAQQAQCSRIAPLRFFEADCAHEVGFGLKVVLPARNRLIGGVSPLLAKHVLVASVKYSDTA